MALVVSSSSAASADPTAPLQIALADFEKSLTESQRRIFLTHVHHAQQQTPDPSTVMQFVAELDAANHGTLRTSVAPRLCTLLDAIQQFTGIIDTFVSSNPSTGALLWGGIKTAILAASNVAHYFDKVTAMIMKIGRTCPVYRGFASVYSDSVPLQGALSEYYAAIVRLALKIVGIMQRSQITQLLSSIVNPFDLECQTLQNQITESARLVELQVSLAASQAAMRSSYLLMSESKKNKEHRGLFRRFKSDFTAEQNENQVRRKLQEAARTRSLIRDCLSTIDHRKPWIEIQKRRYKDTALWFKNEKSFQTWQTNSSTSILWCPGRMGIGKTVLVSNIIAFLCSSPEPIQVMSHHFCRAEHESSTSARNILGTIGHQLMAQQIKEAEGKDLVELLRTCERMDSKGVTDLLLSRLRSDRKHYVIIDGLDECAQTEVIELAKCIRRLCNEPSLHLKILLSGRPELQQSLLGVLDANHRMEISPAVVRIDVERYIENTLFDYLGEQRIQLSNHEVILSIAELLNEQYSDMYVRVIPMYPCQSNFKVIWANMFAIGRFLFAHLFIEELCALSCEAEILAALRNPPVSVGDLIKRKLDRIQCQDFSETAIKVLQYCGITKRPLTIHELGELLSLSVLQRSLDRASIPSDMYRIIAACCGLAFVEEEDETVHYVHRSVKQYFFASVRDSPAEFQSSEIDVRLGQLCLTYLNFSDFDHRLTKRHAGCDIPVAPLEIGIYSIKESHRLINKAAQKLLRSRGHLQRLSPEDLKRKTEDILGTDMSKQLEAVRLQNQFHLLGYVQQFWMHHVAGLTPEDSPKVWQLFCHFVEENSDFVLKPWDSNGQDWVDPSATWALKHSHMALLVFLVMDHLRELPVDRAEEIMRLAVTDQHEQLLRLLAAPASPYSCWGEGLVLAARYGGINCLEFFFKDTKNLSYISHGGQTAMQAAIVNDHVEVVERLLTAGADVNGRGRDGRTSLHYAVAYDRSTIVQRLLAAGADVNARDNNARTPLGYPMSVFLKLDFDIVERLLAAGAVVNHPNDLGDISLHDAVMNDCVYIVKRLLAFGTNIDSRDSTGNTILIWAAVGGRLDTINLLLMNGADVNARNNLTGSVAIHWAARYGYLKIVQRLLAAGANPNIYTFKGYTPLHWAIAESHFDIAEQLLAAGAHVYAEVEGCTPVEVAKMRGHQRVVKWLTEAGACR